MSKYPEKIAIKGRVRVCLKLVKKEKIRNKVVVDIGSSFGWMAKEVLKMRPKKYIGIEPDPEKVGYAKEKVQGADFLVGAAEKEVPVKSGTADIVTMFDVIEHVPRGKELAALKEAKRILKKDGVLLLTTPYNHWLTNITDPAWYFGHRHYEKNKMRKMFEKSGFMVESMEIRGGAWTVIYMLWFYIMKWVLKREINEESWLVKRDDEGYSRKGIFTLLVVGRKKEI